MDFLHRRPRRDLPTRFRPWQTVYDHFRRWRRDGVFARIVEALQLRLDKQGLIDWDLWCVDGASVRAARAAAGTCKKVTRKAAASGTLTSPRTTHWAAAEAGFGPSSPVTDGRGTPLAVEVTAGQVHESTRLEPIIARFIASRKRRRHRKPKKLAGDKGYSVKRIRDWLKLLGIEPVIPHKDNERRETTRPCPSISRLIVSGTWSSSASAGSRSAAASAPDSRSWPFTSMA